MAAGVGDPPPLAHVLADPSRTVVLDGALATALESAGLDLSDSLWSARALHDHPDLIQRVHADYFAAGAAVATTASYQASAPGFAAALGLDPAQSAALIARSVALACAARADAAAARPRPRWVAGSVGPYGAYLADGSEYTGAYGAAVAPAALAAFHRPRIAALLAAGADLLAFETLPSAPELRVLLDLLAAEFPAARAWVALSLAPGDPERLADGTPLAAVVPAVDASAQVVAVGVNCVARPLVLPALRALRALSAKPLLAYPNSGEQWDAEARAWRPGGGAEDELAALVGAWRGAGAQMIGGCCRTGAADVRTIADCLAHECEGHDGGDGARHA